jgi:hypothetical protein
MDEVSRMRFESAVIALLAMAPLASGGCGGRPDRDVLPPEIDASRLGVGEAFPDLVLPSLDGAPRAIREFRGEKLILHIFASW